MFFDYLRFDLIPKMMEDFFTVIIVMAVIALILLLLSER